MSNCELPQAGTVALPERLCPRSCNVPSGVSQLFPEVLFGQCHRPIPRFASLQPLVQLHCQQPFPQPVILQPQVPPVDGGDGGGTDGGVGVPPIPYLALHASVHPATLALLTHIFSLCCPF